MMIAHVAIWARDLEALKDFYVRWFGATSNQRYENKIRGFRSYFLGFGGAGAGAGPGAAEAEGRAESPAPSRSAPARLELMEMPGIVGAGPEGQCGEVQHFGLAHIAIKVASREEVVRLTEELRRAGIRVVSEPRQTGDGYFESCILDPEGNRVEITA